MTRITENTGFLCLQCQNTIHAVTNGCYRNHCPFCLFSRHVDCMPGDRLNSCHGLMEPIGLAYHPKKRWQIVHCCTLCGARSVNKVAIDTIQPDDGLKLAGINMKNQFLIKQL